MDVKIVVIENKDKLADCMYTKEKSVQKPKCEV